MKFQNRFSKRFKVNHWPWKRFVRNKRARLIKIILKVTWGSWKWIITLKTKKVHPGLRVLNSYQSSSSQSTKWQKYHSYLTRQVTTSCWMIKTKYSNHMLQVMTDSLMQNSKASWLIVHLRIIGTKCITIQTSRPSISQTSTRAKLLTEAI